MMRLLRAALLVAGAVFSLPAFAQDYNRPLAAQAGTITTGGTAQTLFGGNVPVNGWEVCNPDASNDLWVSDVGTAAANAQGSYRAAANGGCYLTPRTGQPNVMGAVSVVGSVTGQKFSARKW